jgi:hypothetical protein
MARRRRSSDA